MAGNIRIGIDVGGTFTHAVAIDGDSLTLVGKTKVPTTHRAHEGVARGIVESLQKLLKEAAIHPRTVRFIAHSTTQATNALLEGDVAPVGILGMGRGASAGLARFATNTGKISLAPGKFLQTFHRFLDTSQGLPDSRIKDCLNRLIEQGARAVAVSEAFGVDEPENEMRAVELARDMGLPATAGSEVSQLYGLTVRTRTAVINASMLPKMMEAAEMTERSVREAGIKAPIMIMRSDGGVMDIDSMRRRPIQTMLSGPAAGVAAAMMYLHISDGIFLEVGGTSTDISAIRNGKALVKSAEVGGHKVYMRTLDVRTVGIAGGSIARARQGALIDVGPRSAHIAGLGYVSFCDSLESPQIRTIQPLPTDPSDYIALAEDQGPPGLCLTPTCAANLLGLVPPDDCAAGNIELIKKGFAALSSWLKMPPEEAARRILHLSAGKCEVVVSRILKDYKLDPDIVKLYGGGGGAAAIVPFLAGEVGLRHELSQVADVISAIGVALALVRETVERNIVHPSSDDILRVRQEAQAAVQRMGADPSTVEIHVEVDTRTNTVRATASGATSLTAPEKLGKGRSEEERLALVADSMRVPVGQVKLLAQSNHFQAFGADTSEAHLRGLIRIKRHSLRVLDDNGIIRFQARNGAAREGTVATAEKVIADLAEEHAQYGDAGRVVPPLMLFAGPKMVDLSGLLDTAQMIALAKIELEMLPRDEKIIVIADRG
jgi:N-methylhydantoinase A/oxoprolinase/acetone carboxylase beta subunit